MSEPTEFRTLLRRLREGDGDAVVEFIERYGRAVRTFAHIQRVRLHVSPADMDSEDVQQAVLASFCVRVQWGRYELESEDALRRLLCQMVRYKAIDVARKNWREDEALEMLAREGAGAGAGGADSAYIKAAIDEINKKARSLCTDEEWELIQLHKAGRSWEEIGATLGEKPDTVRKRHERLVRRLETALRLPEVDDE
jgi:RNA polymerase sigma factor (sigma-70 family)